MRIVSAVRWSPLAIAGLLAAACGEPATAPALAPVTPIIWFAGTVTDPIAPALGAAAAPVPRRGVSANVVTVDRTAYVSLSPGTEPGGAKVTIRNHRTDNLVSAQMVAGGFDPIGIDAAVGDTLEITIVLTGGDVKLAKSIVPVQKPPRVVRTEPVKGRTDLAINATIAVVFSEPIDPATLDGESIRLMRNGVAVSGFVRPVLGSTAVEFVPRDPLLPETAYQLVIDDLIADLAGDRLTNPQTVEFTTAPVAPDSTTGVVTPPAIASGVYDLYTTITSFDPAWGENLWDLHDLATLTFGSDPRPGIIGTFTDLRVNSAGDLVSYQPRTGVITSSMFNGRLVLNLFSDAIYDSGGRLTTSAGNPLTLGPVGDLAGPVLQGTFGCCGHIGGTFTATRRAGP